MSLYCVDAHMSPVSLLTASLIELPVVYCASLTALLNACDVGGELMSTMWVLMIETVLMMPVSAVEN